MDLLFSGVQGVSKRCCTNCLFVYPTVASLFWGGGIPTPVFLGPNTAVMPTKPLNGRGLVGAGVTYRLRDRAFLIVGGGSSTQDIMVTLLPR